MPLTTRVDPISTKSLPAWANLAWSQSQPCHEHLVGLLLYSLGKQHVMCTHLLTLLMGSFLSDTGINQHLCGLKQVCLHSAVPTTALPHHSCLLRCPWPLTCRSCTWW